MHLKSKMKKRSKNCVALEKMRAKPLEKTRAKPSLFPFLHVNFWLEWKMQWLTTRLHIFFLMKLLFCLSFLWCHKCTFSRPTTSFYISHRFATWDKDLWLYLKRLSFGLVSVCDILVKIMVGIDAYLNVSVEILGYCHWPFNINCQSLPHDGLNSMIML